ncbi:AAA family ATPase [Patescibacteria group bacterium]|nr:AAA family ATPase [Patescibacteria group bacterium]
MRISSFTIKNYRSINSIENFELLDKKITCLIGKNGSGKSNILYALMALKDNHLLTDECHFEKKDKEKTINIGVQIQFDKRDDDILEKNGLSRSAIQGFNVALAKEIGEIATCTFEPVGFGKSTESGVLKNVTEIISLVKEKLPKKVDSPSNPAPEAPVVNPENQTPPETPHATPQPPAEKTEDTLDKFYLFVENEWENGDKTTIFSQKDKVLGFLDLVKDLTNQFSDPLGAETKNKLEVLIHSTQKGVNFDLTKLLSTKFWKKLNINLLSFSDYQIESSAKYSELESGTAHPFLKDLIELTGKEVKDFGVKKSSLTNNLRDAAENLNSALGKVFTQYKLKMEISAQKRELVFLFETPQGRVRELTDLSEGEQWFLRFYTKLAVASKEDTQIIWLFDEPGQYLHSTGQIDLKKFFEKTSENSPIIYTSHQPVMIQWHRLERIFVVENCDKERGTIIHSRFWKDSDLESPIKELLGLFVGEQILTGENHVIVEGISDYIHLRGWLIYFQNTREDSDWKESSDSFRRIFVPTKGYPTIPLYLKFLADRSRNKITSIGLVDTDSAKAEITESGLSKEFVLSLDEIVKGLIEEQKKSKRKKPLKFPEQVIKDIEDLYTHEEFLLEVQDYISLGTWLPGLKVNRDFCNPKEEDLKDSIVKYIENSLNKSNPDHLGKPGPIELDKTGVAMHIYKKLVNVSGKKKIFDKTTEKKFEEIFKSLNQQFELDAPQEENIEES